MKDFRNLTVWRKSHRLALAVYESSRKFPQDERYGLTSQLRRAAVSVPTDIAEGCGRQGDPDFARFLSFAMGSASETEYLLLLANELGLLNGDTHRKLSTNTEEIKRMLATLIAKLKADR